jgi:hypothetical protein
MAAVVLLARRGRKLQSPASRRTDGQDGDDDVNIPAQFTYDELEIEKNTDQNLISSGPVIISPDVLMGTMPKPEKFLKHEVVGKLTSSYEWKPMNMVLTSMGLFFSRPDEEVLRDLIPLFEVLDVRKRKDIPNQSEPTDSKPVFLHRNASLRTIKMSSLMSEPEESADGQNIIQIRTVDNGYNSGRTYYLRIETARGCTEWLAALRSASERALVLKKAGPNALHTLRLRLRRFYRSTPVQCFVAVLIFSSFVVNIAQVLHSRKPHGLNIIYIIYIYIYFAAGPLPLLLAAEPLPLLLAVEPAAEPPLLLRCSCSARLCARSLCSHYLTTI